LGLGNDVGLVDPRLWAYSVPGVKIVSNVLLNGGTGDGRISPASS
jgi:hypothetical protein